MCATEQGAREEEEEEDTEKTDQQQPPLQSKIIGAPCSEADRHKRAESRVAIQNKKHEGR
eukprot:CAMPEP_0206609662 /NCGR_PEP_ID=MMETSP0325_2-20121206/53952_1 /ASSEMBLY_ACC=CAM_ASM_000347 /TAXON_ID=2866 /ORGANISM="Crypthecodinium cohnii, Strain Seligo" /LENGTH=59 /DNA_ID=CAMNT_0054128055 /DNA_START=223 /DNA_END=399 /DNA_ORIENTATION=-